MRIGIDVGGVGWLGGSMGSRIGERKRGSLSSRPLTVMSAGMNYDDARQQGIVGLTRTKPVCLPCPDLASGNRSLVRVGWIPYMKFTQ